MRRLSAAACLTLLIAVALTAAPAPAATPVCRSQSAGALPDSTCTPGATNPAVVQGDISDTICKSGWSAIVRPPATVTEPQKFKAMAAYGIPTTAGHAGLYEYDHLIPIELGGAVDSTVNLWPEAHSAIYLGHQEGSYVKDRLENRLRSLVCAGNLPLLTAQAAIGKNWPAAYLKYVGPLPA